MIQTETRPPLPPFTHETATQKVRLAEDAWNLRGPQRVSLQTGSFIGCATTTVDVPTTIRA